MEISWKQLMNVRLEFLTSPSSESDANNPISVMRIIEMPRKVEEIQMGHYIIVLKYPF